MRPWWIRIGAYAIPNRGALVQIAMLIVMGAALTALAPWPLKLIVDYVLPQGSLPPEGDALGSGRELGDPNVTAIWAVLRTATLQDRDRCRESKGCGVTPQPASVQDVGATPSG